MKILFYVAALALLFAVCMEEWPTSVRWAVGISSAGIIIGSLGCKYFMGFLKALSGMGDVGKRED